MKFATPLDELQHWLGQLTVDVAMGAARRHLEAEARLCWVLIEQIEAFAGDMDQEVYTRLSLQLLDLQRGIDPRPARSVQPKRAAVAGPMLRLVSNKRGARCPKP